MSIVDSPSLVAQPILWSILIKVPIDSLSSADFAARLLLPGRLVSPMKLIQDFPFSTTGALLLDHIRTYNRGSNSLPRFIAPSEK